MGEKKEIKNKKEKRSRTFATILYPESAKENWLEILSELCVPCYISPLHEFDTDENGEIKKAHFHILVCYNSLHNREDVVKIAQKINAVNVITVMDKRAMLLYLIHAGYKDKYQYDAKDVITLGGATDYMEIIMDNKSNKIEIINDMFDYIDHENIIYFSDFINHARFNEKLWLEVLLERSYSYLVFEYIKSQNFKRKS